ncbi:MAG: hypothetical protein MI864_27985 [Pseudomonadales bacterium]|nr:hypothetical protein [Pseudomonadales bacterium]
MQQEPLPRRDFLKLTLVASTVSAFGGLAIARTNSPAIKRTQYGYLLQLDEDQAEVMHAFAETVLPRGDGFPTADQARVVQRLDEELFFVSPQIASDLKAALDALQWMPMAYGYFSRFSRLDIERRLQFLKDTQNTVFDTVRAVVSGCRIICFNLYYGHESTWPAIGYDGPYSGIPEQIGAQRRHYAELINVA